MKVRFLGPFAQKSGYGAACHDYLMALRSAGIDLDIRPILEADTEDLPERYHSLIPFVNREDAKDPGWPDVFILHTIPAGAAFFDADLPPEHVKRVFLTTWETSKVPRPMIEEIKNKFDQVWLPTDYCVQAFYDSGVPRGAIRKVEHSFDFSWWLAGDEGSKEDKFTFYTILTWCERKNPIGLLKAYLTEFTEKDNVLLKIKTPGYTKEQIEELARGLYLSYYPPVDIVTDHFSEKELRWLHYSSDCYVTCARSEGWGLGAFEALMTGNPVIATGYSGLLEFLDGAENVETLPYLLTPAYTPESRSNSEINVSGMKITAVNRNDHLGITGDQYWAEPSLYHLKQFMRRAYSENWKKSNANAEWLQARYSHKVIGKKALNVLEDLVKR